MSPFARTCQATHLLSRVIVHINTGEDDSNPAHYYRQALHLHQVILSFHNALHKAVASGDTATSVELSSAVGICSTALIALCDQHTCADLDNPAGIGIPEQLKMQSTALETLQEIMPMIAEWAARLTHCLDETAWSAMASPFVSQSVYSAAKQLLCCIRETEDRDLLPLVNRLISLLTQVGRRWHAASTVPALPPSYEICVSSSPR